jgi:hypothetical protein
MKQIFFLSGFPRCGNTLLTSILSQNKNIKTTAHSILPEIFYKINLLKNHNIFKNFPDEKSLNNVMKNIFKNYYENWNTDIIIDRGDWITPYNLNLLKTNYPNYKIVILVRDIIDILKSYLKLCNQNSNFEYNQYYNQLDKTTLYTDREETLCDMFMQKGHYIDTILYSIKNLLNNNEKNIKFIEYKDLVNNTISTLKSIYSFYEIDYYEHKLNNLSQFSVNNLSYNDEIIGAPMHTIRTEKIDFDKTDLKISEKIIKKYSNLEFWR